MKTFLSVGTSDGSDEAKRPAYGEIDDWGWGRHSMFPDSVLLPGWRNVTPDAGAAPAAV
jgi:hypothetical protein